MFFNRREDIIAITSTWKGERFEDGRPKVDDKLLDALYDMTLEEVWFGIKDLGYRNQFIAMKSIKPEFNPDGTPGIKLVGRAVTAAYAPSRPDYYEVSNKLANEQGYVGTANQWVIESLQARDVIVIDMFDKVFEGTFVGGNLSTSIHTRTGNGGAVIWGGIRDTEQIKAIPDIQVYYRGQDPTPIMDIVMTGFNTPVRIGSAERAVLCLPGDVIYGSGGGVFIIPPHLVAKVVETGRKSKVRDLFGFEMLAQKKYTTVEIDKDVWTLEMMDLLVDYIKNDPEGQKFADLDWTQEYQWARDLENEKK